VGDAAVLDLVEGSFEYVDVMGERITGEHRLEVRHVIVGGALWHSAAAAA
jgi:dihydroorotase